ncbi:energy transducer TonB [Sphingomonas sp. GCM10030256]|uniref:energy transducer TonB n=1 Tax=Sphingomonas sp. GCM10030256 TaxID=3273427 RepID=UPI0036102EB1
MPYASNRTDRATAALLVIVIHAGMAIVLANGFRADTANSLTDALKSFEVLDSPEPELPPEDIPPPPDVPELDIPPPPDAPLLPLSLLQMLPQLSLAAPPEAPAAPNIVSAPAPVIAPTPAVQLPLPSPVRTAEVSAPVSGTDRTVGAAAVAGPGTGAAGSGTGFGGGGSGGNGAGGGGIGRPASYVPGSARARLPGEIVRTAPAPAGRLPLRLSILPTGRVGACAPLATSGSPILDSALCRSVAAHSRWIPATDRAGQPITVDLVFQATWTDR